MKFDLQSLLWNLKMWKDTLCAHKQTLTIVTFITSIYIIMNKLSCLHIHIITLNAIFHPNQGSNIIRKIHKNFIGSELFFVFIPNLWDILNVLRIHSLSKINKS